MNNPINIPVSITALSFGRDMSAIPKRMEWAGRIYDFIDRGISVRSRRGEHVSSTVTCSDGTRTFCLRQSGAQWTLLSVC